MYFVQEIVRIQRLVNISRTVFLVRRRFAQQNCTSLDTRHGSAKRSLILVNKTISEAIVGFQASGVAKPEITVLIDIYNKGLLSCLKCWYLQEISE